MTDTIRSRSVALYAPLGSFAVDRGPAAYAPALCQAIGASLTGLLFNIEANATPSADGLSLSAQEQQARDRDQANAANAAQLEQRCSALSVPARTVTAIDHSQGLINYIADHARLHDVLITGSRRSGPLSDRIMAENLLFETGRPLLVVPEAHDGQFAARRIVAAWDNSRNAARALGDALALLPQIEDVVLLTVGDEKAIRSTLDQADLVASIARRGIAASVEQRSLNGRKIGEALQDTAIELDADLLVMGGCGHSRLRDFLLGGATISVLDNPRLPVLLSH